MHKLTHSLLFWVILAIVFGIILGLVVPKPVLVPFVTFNAIFGQILSFAVPLIIVGLVAPAITDLGKGAGKWLLATVAIAYGSTLFAGFGTYGIAQVVYPWMLKGEKMANLKEPGGAAKSLLGENFTIDPVFGVMTALVLAFVFGLGMIAIHSDLLRRSFNEFREIMMWLIKRFIVPCLPIFIFGTFMNLAKSGEIANVIYAMLKIILFSVVLCIILLIIQYIVAGAIAGVNPFKALGRMMNAFFTALGTSSSAATIPVTYQCMMKNGISREVAGFTAPLCATIHLGGSTTKIVAFSLAIIFMTGGQASFGSYAAFIFMLGIIMVAAPGVPGGAIAASQAVLTGILGFSDPQYALMVALYVAIDSFGTATNVTGDGAIGLVVNRLAGGSLGSEKTRARVAATDIASSAE